MIRSTRSEYLRLLVWYGVSVLGYVQIWQGCACWGIGSGRRYFWTTGISMTNVGTPREGLRNVRRQTKTPFCSAATITRMRARVQH
jgi:hypothetical protein